MNQNANYSLHAIVVAVMILSVSMMTSVYYRSVSGELSDDDRTYDMWWELGYTITADEYNEYAVMVSQRNIYDDWEKYITVTPLIQEIADQLYYPYDLYRSATAALWFVSSISYAYDIDTYGINEYWAYPMEMLYHHQGDCEDASFLYISILTAMTIISEPVFAETHVYVKLIIDGIEYRAEPTYGYNLIMEE